MPALLLLLGVAVVVFITAAGHHGPNHPALQPAQAPLPGAVVVELDRDMPSGLVDQVLAALGRETEPDRLDVLATSLGPRYPLSASELHAKAMTLRERRDAASPSPTPVPTPAAEVSAPTPSPAPTPEAGGSGGPDPAQSSTPAPETAPAPTPKPADAPSQVDSSAATVLQAAMRALVEETDPVVLEGFAESIRVPYPAAAEILAGRATVLRASPPDDVASAGSPAPATPSPSRSMELSS